MSVRVGIVAEDGGLPSRWCVGFLSGRQSLGSDRVLHFRRGEEVAVVVEREVVVVDAHHSAILSVISKAVGYSQ